MQTTPSKDIAPATEQSTLIPVVACYSVDTALYTKEALFRTCYVFTDRCYLFLTQVAENTVTVEFKRRHEDVNLEELVGAFANELISQRVRGDIEMETRAIRERIVAQAFAEADFHGPES